MAGSTTTAQYTGRSMEDLLRMPVMATQYEYEQEKKLQDMMDEAAVLEILKNESQDADVYTQYAEFQNRLKDQIQRGQQQGFYTVAKDLFNTHQDYHSTIEPIKNAYNKREEARKTYNNAILKDPSLVTNINPNEIGLSAYMGTNEKTAPQIYTVSGNQVMSQAEKAMQQASKNKVFSEPVQYAMDRMLFKIQSGYGYSENDIDELMQYPEVRQIAEGIKNSPEVQRLGNNKDAVDNYIVRGILQGRQYDKNVSYMNAPKAATPTGTNPQGSGFDFDSDPLTGMGMFYMTDTSLKDLGAREFLDENDNVKWGTQPIYERPNGLFNRGEITGWRADTKYTTVQQTGPGRTTQGSPQQIATEVGNNRPKIFPIIKEELLDNHPEFRKKGYSDEALYWYYFGDSGLTPEQRATYKAQAEKEGIMREANDADKKEEVRQALIERREKDERLKKIPIFQSFSKWDKDEFRDYLMAAEPRSVHLLESYDSNTQSYKEAKPGELEKMLNNPDNMSDVTYGYDPNTGQFLAQFNYGSRVDPKKDKQSMKRYTVGFTPTLTSNDKIYLNNMFGEKVEANGKVYKNRYEYLQKVYNNLQKAVNQITRSGENVPEELLYNYFKVYEELNEISDRLNDFRFDKIQNRNVNTNTASAHNG